MFFEPENLLEYSHSAIRLTTKACRSLGSSGVHQVKRQIEPRRLGATETNSVKVCAPGRVVISSAVSPEIGDILDAVGASLIRRSFEVAFMSRGRFTRPVYSVCFRESSR